jgi:hypothetical protein
MPSPSAPSEFAETIADIGSTPQSRTRSINSSALRPCAPATASLFFELWRAEFYAPRSYLYRKAYFPDSDQPYTIETALTVGSAIDLTHAADSQPYDHDLGCRRPNRTPYSETELLVRTGDKEPFAAWNCHHLSSSVFPVPLTQQSDRHRLHTGCG